MGLLSIQAHKVRFATLSHWLQKKKGATNCASIAHGLWERYILGGFGGN